MDYSHEEGNLILEGVGMTIPETRVEYSDDVHSMLMEMSAIGVMVHLLYSRYVNRYDENFYYMDCDYRRIGNYTVRIIDFIANRQSVWFGVYYYPDGTYRCTMKGDYDINSRLGKLLSRPEPEQPGYTRDVLTCR